jgi:hypothetical protein
VVKCYTRGHNALVVISVIIGAAFVAAFMLPWRQPLSKVRPPIVAVVAICPSVIPSCTACCNETATHVSLVCVCVQHSFFVLGVPYLVPAVVLTRAVLAWSAKIVPYFDVCGSLTVSFVCNAALTCLLLLALDSGKLSFEGRFTLPLVFASERTQQPRKLCSCNARAVVCAVV